MADEKQLADYRCPQCDQEMERGFVTATQSIRWAVDEKQGGFFGIAAEVLKKGGWTTHPKCPALRCKKCQLVVFQY